jgi:hypothetical protein
MSEGGESHLNPYNLSSIIRYLSNIYALKTIVKLNSKKIYKLSLEHSQDDP